MRAVSSKNIKHTENLNAHATTYKVKAFDEIKAFVEALELPRVIMLLVPAGPIVDAVVAELKPLINAEDIIT